MTIFVKKKNKVTKNILYIENLNLPWDGTPIRIYIYIYINAVRIMYIYVIIYMCVYN